MKYTENEIQQIRANIKKIEQYLTAEILPQITESIYIDFSEIQYRPDGSSFKHTYALFIDNTSKPIFISSALWVVLDEHTEDTSTSVNAYTNWRYTVKLLEEWQTVKHKLHEEINKRNAKKSALLNFQI